MSLNDPGAAAAKPRFFPDAAVRSGRSAGPSGPSGPPLDGLLAWYFSTLPVDGTTVPDLVGGRNATASSSALDGKTVWDDAGVTIALPAEAALLAADKWGFLFSTGDAPLALALPAQLLADPYNPASWSTSSGAVLSIPSEGVLRIAYGGYNYPMAYQTILTAGKIFRVTGEGRSDGTALPSVQDNAGAFLWTGTSSTGWQPFCIEDVAAGTRIQFKALMIDDNYCEFRNIRTMPRWWKSAEVDRPLRRSRRRRRRRLRRSRPSCT
jgi:hypothetical protein